MGRQSRGGRLMGRVSSFEMRIEAHGRRRTLYLSGELDMAQAPQLLGVIARLSAPGEELVLDLAGLTFVDSSGLRSLLTAHADAARTGAHLMATRLQPSVARVVAISGLQSAPPFAARPAMSVAAA